MGKRLSAIGSNAAAHEGMYYGIWYCVIFTGNRAQYVQKIHFWERKLVKPAKCVILGTDNAYCAADGATRNRQYEKSMK